MNLSSIVVLTTPNHLEDVLENIRSSDKYEYHMHDEKGRIIVTIEGADVEEEIKKLKHLQKIIHVISAEMVFAYSEEELEKERNKLENSTDNLPDWLNNQDAKAGEIKYGGDLKKRF